MTMEPLTPEEQARAQQAAADMAMPTLPPMPDVIYDDRFDAPVDPDQLAVDATRAPLLDHLIELRRRLLWSLGALVLCFILCFYFVQPIYGFLVQPLLNAGQSELYYSRLFEAFFVQIKVALFAAFMLAFPIIATQVWRFVAPGLYRNEKRALLPFLLATPVLFLAGAALAYYAVLPFALHFLLSFQKEIGGVTQQALPSVADYLDTVMHFIIAFGVAFLLPILLMLLERSGIVTLEQLRSARRYMIVVAFAIAAVFTPPDPWSMLLLAVPLCLLYEGVMVVISLTRRRSAVQSG